MPEQSAFEQLYEEVRRLKEAKELLECVYSELGPYTSTLSPKLMEKLRIYFCFDDQE